MSSKPTPSVIVTGKDTPSAQAMRRLSDVLLHEGKSLKLKIVTAGFDGFVDTIIRVIKNKHAGAPDVFFNTTTEFGSYIVEKGGSSFGLEVEQRNIKLGGNMPIMANALGFFGVQVNCVGALGFPDVHPIFKSMSSNCHLFGFVGPAASTAFEFNDGKIMFAQMGELNGFGWEKIKKTIGVETLISLYESSDMYCILNWSEIDASSDIWKGILRDVLPHCKRKGKKQTALFDLSDFSKRSGAAIREAIMLLKEFSRYASVTLSLNKNETRSVFELLFDEQAIDDVSTMGKRIFENLGVEILLLHSPRHAMAINAHGDESCETFFVEYPKLSTGAGDHFNAGFAVGQLLDLDQKLSLILANAVSAFYVKTGDSPKLSDVIAFLSENHGRAEMK